MSYFKQILHVASKEEAGKFTGLSDSERRQIDELYFKDDYKALQVLMNTSTKSPAFRAYAKEKFEDLQLISWDKKNKRSKEFASKSKG